MIKFTLTLNDSEADELLSVINTGLSSSTPPHPAGTERIYQKLKAAVIVLRGHVTLIKHGGLDEKGNPEFLGKTEHVSLNMAAVNLALTNPGTDSKEIEEALEEHGIWSHGEFSWELTPVEVNL